MDELLKYPLSLTTFVFFAQLLFIYLRTINVIYTTEGKIWKTVITGMVMSLVWLISTAIGLNSAIEAITSVFNGTKFKTILLLPLFGYLSGGGLGVYFGMIQESHNRKGERKKQ